MYSPLVTQKIMRVLFVCVSVFVTLRFKRWKECNDPRKQRKNATKVFIHVEVRDKLCWVLL